MYKFSFSIVIMMFAIVSCQIGMKREIATTRRQLMPEVKIWSVDALEKVFEDAQPKIDNSCIKIEAVRNEYVSGQGVFRCDEQHLMGARVDVEPLIHQETGYRIEPVNTRFVGFVPVRDNTPKTPVEHLVRVVPKETFGTRFPDPLLEESSMHVRKGISQPIWLTVKIPADAPAGEYQSAMTVHSRNTPDAKLDIRLTVYPVTLPEARTLKVTNWFNLGAIAGYHGAEMFDERFFQMLQRYALFMAEHRQNVVLTSLSSLIEFGAGSDERLKFDFTRFDRFVELFKEAGVIGFIEGGHLGGRKGDWNEGFVVNIRQVRNGQVISGSADAGSAEAEEFLSQFLPALQEHLKSKGWLDIYYQHLADEPVSANADSYNCIVDAVRRYAPSLKLIEANMCEKIEHLDVWVPLLNGLGEKYEFYKSRQEAGQEVWFYTCLAPTGTYANRLIDYPLLKVRLLHWLNFHYNTTGYLHWGLNFWGVPNPFTDVERVHTPNMCLPPGDAGIVYPGPKGPLSSLRFEAMRDGIEDYELFMLLAQRDEAKAKAISGSIIRGFNEYELNVNKFNQARRQLLKETVGVE
jgi:hypothetical protein